MCNWIVFWFADCSEDPTCFPRNTKNPFESCIWDLKLNWVSDEARVRFMLLIAPDFESDLAMPWLQMQWTQRISPFARFGLEVVFRKPWQRMLSGNYILSSNEEEEMWMLRSLLFSLRWHRSDDMSGAECCDLKHGPLGQERCWQVTLRVLDCFPQREVQWVGGAVSARSLKAAKMCSFVKQLRCFLPS